MRLDLTHRYILTEERIVIEEGITDGRARELLQPWKGLFSQRKTDLLDGRFVFGRGPQHRDIKRQPAVAGARRLAKRLRRIGDAGYGPGASLPKLMALEGSHLLPIERKDPVCQIRNRHTENIFGVFGQVLDAVVNQSHKRRELVGGVTLASFEDCDDALA